ncbi:MAG TPA: hypothetical protein VKC61_13135 [Pyrinomonadaceae bacterium]|nr:hypothetical protein [Pyrinomonadaceae bacterium]
MYLSRSKKSLFLFACVGIVLGVVVWASGRIPSKQQTPKEVDIRIQNKTSALKIISTRKVGEGDVARFEVVVMNQSDKTVLAYTFSSGESGLTSFGLNLAPGESNTEKILVSNLEPSSLDKSVSYLRLSAVYLDDRSSEGEMVDVNRLKNRMLGIEEQSSIALQALHKASSSGESDPERLTMTMEDAISSRSTTADRADIASERLAGREFIKEKISRETNQIRANKRASGTNGQEMLDRLIRSLEKLSGAHEVGKQEEK